jgi:hypothetical protein
MKMSVVSGLLFAAAPFTPVNGQVSSVTYASLSGSQVVTFDDLPSASASGTNYDPILLSGGVAFGERFQGQTLGSSGDFDVLTGLPSGGTLVLLPGAPNQNLDILLYNGTNTLTGLGPLGYPNFGAVGEGAISLLFSSDQSQFGFQLVGGNSGDANVSFFRADGSLIQTLVLSGLADSFYGFARDGGVQDIRGISITNTDSGGIGFDNLKHDVLSAVVVSGVPEPSTWAMMLLGFSGIGLAMRRGKRRVGAPMQIA